MKVGKCGDKYLAEYEAATLLGSDPLPDHLVHDSVSQGEVEVFVRSHITILSTCVVKMPANISWLLPNG